MIDVPDFFREGFNFVVELPRHGFLFWVKTFFLALIVFLAVAIVWLLKTTTWLKDRYGYDIADLSLKGGTQRTRLMKQWEEILAKVKASEVERKLALLEAERLLEDFLEAKGLKGAGIAERLSNLEKGTIAPPLLLALQEAGRVITGIVADPDYKLSLEAAQKVIAVYDQAIKELTELGV